MKTILKYFLIITLFSCNNSKNNNDAPIVEHNRIDISSNNDDLELSSEIFSDIFVNETAFNGIFVLAPGQHATVTLSIDGIVKYTSLLPGKYVQRGELLATLENLEFINLQQSYLEACAQCEYLEAEYKRQEILSHNEVASQKRYQESKAEYLSMKSRKDAAAAQLTMLGLSPQSVIEKGISPLLEVRAPISGYISNLQMNTGKHINYG